jgi:N-carbamoylputrescine amidase
MKIALIQHSYRGSKEKTLQTTIEKIGEAAQNNTQLVILQELHQTEYFCQSEDTKFFNYASSYDEDLKYWSSNEHKFVLEKGTVNFFIGTSSASPVLEGKLLIK